MNYLKISDNIINFRRKKGITQDELATFLGVTKASVSKWETRQSFPDILLLPQIASYFDVTIDELLGYEPQLSSEQIKKCYQDLASDYANIPFDEVVEKSKKLVKKYYSCYPFLIQIVLLWINHFMLTNDTEKQVTLLSDAVKLCEHIRDGSTDAGICNSAIAMKALVNLTLGNPETVIEELQPLLELKQFILQSDSVLIQAYQMLGDKKHADLHSQITAYSHLLNLVEISIGLIAFHMEDIDYCESTIHRIRMVIDTYHLEKLHPNTTLKFHYQVALFYCVQNQLEKAMEELTIFVKGSLAFIESGLELHGDAYFNLLDDWFDGFALKKDAPRDKKVVLDSLIPALEHPSFQVLAGSDQYNKLKQRILRKIEEV